VAAAATIARRPPASSRSVLSWWLAAAGCLLFAALSLLIARQPTYDPTAWLIWGREVVHGDLSTTAGPSWKPLPIVITAPTALLGDTAQAQVWLVVARTGTLAAVGLAYRLAWRLEGAAAGVVAAAALLCSTGFTARTFRGNSEGLLVAVAFGAIEAHLSGRRRLAFALLVAATLLRPELFLFAAGYGLWLVWTAPDAVRRGRTLAVAASAGVLVVAAWLIPEQVGSGQLFRAASRALEPVAGSPATAAFPFLATFTNAAPALPWPLYAAGVAYVALAVRDVRRGGEGRGARRALTTLALAAIATAVMVLIALMAQAGFTGNIRYLTIPIALTGVVGAAGLVRVARLARARLSPRAATVAIALGAVVAAPFAVAVLLRTIDQFRGGLHESRLYAALPAALARAGGPAAVLRCGTPAAAPFDVQTLARALHVHQAQVGFRPVLPGTLVLRRDDAAPLDRRFPNRTVTPSWVIASSCPR
jgi:hypothetical protein